MATTRSTSCIKTTCCLLAGLLLASGCTGPTEPPPAELTRIDARSGSLHVEFNRPTQLQGITVYDRQHRLLQSLPTAGRRSAFNVPFDWQAAIHYGLELDLADQTIWYEWQAPLDEPPVRFELEAPLGQDPLQFGFAERAEVLVPADGAMTLGFVATNEVQAENEISIACEPDNDLLIEQAEPRWQRADDGTLHATSVLAFDADYVQLTMRVRLKPGASAGRLKCRAMQTIDGVEVERSLNLKLRTATPEELAGWIVPHDVVFPADGQGRAQPERLSDSIVLPNPVWSAIRRWFRPADAVFNYHAPYAHHALDLHNASDLPLNVVIESDVHVAGRDAPLMEFAPPVWASPVESPTSEQLLRIQPGEDVVATLPLFVRREVQPGRYERRFRIYPVGGHEPIASLAAPVYVVRGNAMVSGVVVACLVVSFAAWGTLALGGRRLLRRLDNDALAIIATVASLHFVVSYLARIGGDIVASVTGPFNLFIAGVANEGLTCLMLALVVVLLPRPGTATVSGVTVFLLNAMFTGQFGLVDLLFVTVSILLTEAALALAGITTRPLPSGGHASWSVLLRLGAAVGLANALTWYAQFCLMQVLLRLFFADWYVVAVCVLTGLIYGGLGAAAGTTLGYRLRRTAR